MNRLGSLGTQIRLPDGREATVVYNGLEGIGAKLGLHSPSSEDFVGSSGGLLRDNTPVDFLWFPDILLRDPNDWTPPRHEFDGMECVCHESEVEIITENRPALRDSGSTTSPEDEEQGDLQTNPED